MAADTSALTLLHAFTAATDAAQQHLTAGMSIFPPPNGITLLDTKNEIFLSYLEALSFRNLLVIQSYKDGTSLEQTGNLEEKITKKLTELRLYLERGVRPLEQKIKYQVDRVVRVADDAERAPELTKGGKGGRVNREALRGDESDGRDSEELGSDDSEDGVDALAYRPNTAAFVASSKSGDSHSERNHKSKEGKIYRPPRIYATAMPTSTATADSRDSRSRRPARSATVDEYISTELSTAPLVEASIGSNIASSGRRNKSTRQLREDAERQEYEETHLVRLPQASKKERALQRRGERQGFGGEEWKGLEGSVERIAELTRRKAGKESVLEKSRKRMAESEDGPRRDGIGSAFEIKKRRVLKKLKK